MFLKRICLFTVSDAPFTLNILFNKILVVYNLKMQIQTNLARSYIIMFFSIYIRMIRSQFANFDIKKKMLQSIKMDENFKVNVTAP